MRLGGPVFGSLADPAAWVEAVQQLGYRAANCPVGPDATDGEVAAYAKAAAAADIVIAEVGTWSNPLSPDEDTQTAAMEKCQRGLDLADRIGARCCVNIAGSRGEKWDGPCALDLTEETFAMVVDSVREIIDAVRPTRTSYSLETMPWMIPDSAHSYLRLIAAIDRPAFGVHLDAANLICSPQRYFGSAALIEDFVTKLGPRIHSCHAKDIILRPQLTTHLDEVAPGLGGIDYAACLHQLNRLHPDTPVMLEHLATPEEYAAAATYLRQVAKQEGLVL
jgi:sugar phosphate isomerase/epimerase